MVKHWQPGTDYDRGDVVKYHGQKFKAIQKHESLETWAPGVTPALWGKLEDDDSDDEHSDDHHGRKHKHEHEHEHAEVPTYHRPQYQNDQATPQYQNAPQQQNTTPPQYHNDQGYAHQEKPPQHSEEEKKGNWFSDHKTELEVGMGALAIGGAGYGIKKYHDGSKEEDLVQQGKPSQNVEEQKSWLGEHKTLVGVGALAAAGAGAYAIKKHHDKTEEEEQNNSQGFGQQGQQHEDEQKSWLSEHKTLVGVGALAAAGAGAYALKKHHDNAQEEHQNPPPSQYHNNQDEEKPSWMSEHKTLVGVGALAAAGAGAYALKKHHDNAQEEEHNNNQGFGQQVQQHEDEQKSWLSEHKTLVGVGALAAAGAGAYALKKHHDNAQEEEQNNNQGSGQQVQQHEDEQKSWLSEHKTLVGVGALAAAGAGAYAIKKHHDNSQGEEQNNNQGFQQGQQHEEGQKANWFSEHKTELGVGAGLVAAAAGAGYAIKKHHDKSEEEQSARNWARDNWEKDAQIRTEEYRNGMRQGPATWILTFGKNIPEDAIVVGPEHDWMLYICRAYHEGGRQVGKASQSFPKGAVIGYMHEEIHVDTFEVLVGDMRALRWVPFSGRLNVQALGCKPVEGGNENDGTPLYVVKAPFNGFAHPGKTSEKLDGAYIPYGGTEKCVKEYCVLCYN